MLQTHCPYIILHIVQNDEPIKKFRTTMTSYLIIKLGAIGDVAMATAIASELRKSTPADG